jgi:hypothetical protein
MCGQAIGKCIERLFNCIIRITYLCGAKQIAVRFLQLATTTMPRGHNWNIDPAISYL